VVGIPALVALGWWLALRAMLPGAPRELRELEPVGGLVAAVDTWLDGRAFDDALFVVGALVVGALVLLRSGLRTPLGWAIALQLGALLLFSEDVLAVQWNASRATLGIYACALPLLAGPRLREVHELGATAPGGDDLDADAVAG
jgi:hypothetical protein